MIKKIVLLSFLVFSFFLIISSVAAANYYVNTSTKHSDIANWMKKDAKNGDNLIFTGSKYDLTDTIVVSKSVNIKSVNKTQINLKKSKNMFNVTVSGVNFDGLSLKLSCENYGDYGGVYVICAPYASGSSKKINIKNTDINTTGYSEAISIDNWYGNITNCKINMESNDYHVGIGGYKWVGSIMNSKISAGKRCTPIGFEQWNGNIVNSKIHSKFNSIGSIHRWSGKITGSNLSCPGDLNWEGVSLDNSKGTISNSTITVKRGIALGICDEVKVINCSITSGKNYSKIFRYRPDLFIGSVKKSGTTYNIYYDNIMFTDSKPCYLVVKCGDIILKKIHVNSLKGEIMSPGKTVKVSIPDKYANTKYTKTAIIDYYNENKEYDRKNNYYNFKF